MMFCSLLIIPILPRPFIDFSESKSIWTKKPNHWVCSPFWDCWVLYGRSFHFQPVPIMLDMDVGHRHLDRTSSIAILGYQYDQITELVYRIREWWKVKSKTTTAFFIWQKKMNKFRPMEEESRLEIGHEYDGIKSWTMSLRRGSQWDL